MKTNTNQKLGLIILISAFIIVLLAWILQFHDIKKLRISLDNTKSFQHERVCYISSSFSHRVESPTQSSLDSILYDNKDKICVVIPSGLCRACLMSLLQVFKEEQIDNDMVFICLEPGALFDIREIVTKGYDNIMIMNSGITPEWLSNIWVLKFNKEGWLPLLFPFSDGYEDILRLFLKE